MTYIDIGECEFDEYTILQNEIIKMFNPPDTDGSLLHILVEALREAADFIEAAPCVCAQCTVKLTGRHVTGVAFSASIKRKESGDE